MVCDRFSVDGALHMRDCRVCYFVGWAFCMLQMGFLLLPFLLEAAFLQKWLDNHNPLCYNK